MITTPEIWKMIAEETAKLNAIGYYPKKVSSVVFNKMTSFYAEIYYGTGLLKISEYYLNAPVDEFRATIMHELTHIVPEAGHGHGKAWKQVAAKVNKAYPQYNIKRCGSNLANGVHFDLRRAASVARQEPKRVYIVVCDSCGNSYERYRQSRLTQHPEYYRCGDCGAKLHLVK